MHQWLTTWLPVIVPLAASLIVLIRWIAKVDQNTKATEKLTHIFEKFSSVITDRIDQLSHKLDDHEVRLQVVEKVQDKK